MSHFIKKCECGLIITQCRCIGPKVEEIVLPYFHTPNPSTEPTFRISLEFDLDEKHFAMAIDATKTNYQTKLDDLAEFAENTIRENK